MVIEVTREHINKGQKDQADGCPIALAIKGQGWNDVFVFEKYAMIDGHEISLPQEATNFIGAFDGRAPVSPFSFNIGDT